MQSAIEKKSWFKKFLYVVITALSIIIVDQGMKRIAIRYGRMEIEKKVTVKVKNKVYEIVVGVLKNNGYIKVDGIAGMQTVKIIENIYKSIQSGYEICFD